MEPDSVSTGLGPVREVSAGGIVVGPAGVLMIKVKNLMSQVVWTFPKGHLEAGETADQAALREVLEETGWQCRLRGPFLDVHYSFKRDGRSIDKVVHWFRMDPEKRSGEWDPDEVLDCRWVSLMEAKSLVSYKSDHRLVEQLEKGVEK